MSTVYQKESVDFFVCFVFLSFFGFVFFCGSSVVNKAGIYSVVNNIWCGSQCVVRINSGGNPFTSISIQCSFQSLLSDSFHCYPNFSCLTWTLTSEAVLAQLREALTPNLLLPISSRKPSFTEREVRNWNRMPRVESPCLEAFKRQVDVGYAGLRLDSKILEVFLNPYDSSRSRLVPMAMSQLCQAPCGSQAEPGCQSCVLQCPWGHRMEPQSCAGDFPSPVAPWSRTGCSVLYLLSFHCL